MIKSKSMHQFLGEFLLVGGTRPEAIKLAPLHKALIETQEFSVKVVSSGQHAQLFSSACKIMGMPVDFELPAVKPGTEPDPMLGQLITQLGEFISSSSCENVVVLGDTATALAGALCATNSKKRLFHVEAGLRSGDFSQPHPEEAYREAISRWANYHFAPNSKSAKNLKNENVSGEVFVTGSTFIEAMNTATELSRNTKFFMNDESKPHKQYLSGKNTFSILVTVHRRENIPFGLTQVCEAVKELREKLEHARFIIPVHPNPRVDRIVRNSLGKLSRVKLVAPLDYFEMLWLIANVDLIITDSAGVMEEASMIGTPTLIAREKTERRELEKNFIRPTKAVASRIVPAALKWSRQPKKKYKMRAHPFGDVNAARIIADQMKKIILEIHSS